MPGKISRRALIGATTLGATGLAVGPASPTTGLSLRSPLIFHSPKVRKFVDPLPVPHTVLGPRINLIARSTKHRFHSDWEESTAFGYGGRSYLGPTIEAQAHQTTQVAFHNQLTGHPFAADIDTSLHGALKSDATSPRAVLHLHGGVTPPEYDGHTEATINPGTSFVHHYPSRQEAATLWYHDHAMAITRANVYAGLAGLYLLRDQWDTGRADNPLGLPAGNYELPLVLQEKIFKKGGQQSLRSTPQVPQGSWEGGAVGDVGLVNGAVWPEAAVDRGLYRLRVLNAGSFSVWNLFFSNRMTFWVIGNDGGLLDAPAATTNVQLSSGERVDLLVDFSGLRPGETVVLRNDEAPPAQAAIIGEVAMTEFCRFRATARTGHTRAVPARLRGGADRPAPLPAIEQPDRVRNVSVVQLTEFRIPPALMSLNNLRYTSEDIEMPRQGDVEQWNIINNTPDPHPIHLHLVHFRILGRQSYNHNAWLQKNPRPRVGVRWAPSVEPFLNGPLVPPAAWESGKKDVVRVDPRTVTRIIVRFPTEEELGFDPDATFTVPAASPGAGHLHEQPAPPDTDKDPSSGPRPLQGYMWHCHILDHEDHDMMLRFRTVR